MFELATVDSVVVVGVVYKEDWNKALVTHFSIATENRSKIKERQNSIWALKRSFSVRKTKIWICKNDQIEAFDASLNIDWF